MSCAAYSRRGLTGLAGLAALVFAGLACTPDVPDLTSSPDESAQTDPTPAAPQEEPDDDMTLVSLTAAETPVLAALTARFGQKSSDAYTLDDFEALKAAVAKAGVVVADAGKLAEGAASLDAVFRAAQATNTPIVLDNIRDAAGMAAVLGVGIAPAAPAGPGDLLNTLGVYSNMTVLAEPLNDGRDVHLTILGDAGDREFVSEQVDGPDEPPPPAEPDSGNEPVDDESDLGLPLPPEPPPAADPAGMDVDAKVEFIAAALSDRLRVANLAAKLRSIRQNSSPPAGVARRIWTVDFSESGSHWKPAGEFQSAYIEVDFQVELYDSAPIPGPDNKYVRITAKGGAGAAPGALISDENRNRGYFQDRIEVECGPWIPQAWYLPTDWSVYESSPENVNNVTQLSTQTGFQVGVSGDGPAASYSAAQTVTTNLSDFRVVNRTDTVRGSWDFRMSAIGGKPYDFDKPTARTSVQYTGVNVKLRKLPDLATQRFAPNCQMVWQAPGDYQDSVNFRIVTKQTLTKLWIDRVDRISCAGACFGACVCYYRTNHKRVTQTRAQEFVVDFSTVND